MITNETRIIDLTVAELQNIIGKTIKNNFPKQEPQEENIPDLLSVVEAAALLRCSVPTIYGYSHRKVLSTKKIKGCKRIFFSRQELLKMLDAGRSKTNTELEQAANDFVAIKK